MLANGRIGVEGCANSTPARALASISLSELGVLERSPVQCQGAEEEGPLVFAKPARKEVSDAHDEMKRDGKEEDKGPGAGKGRDSLWRNPTKITRNQGRTTLQGGKLEFRWYPGATVVPPGCYTSMINLVERTVTYSGKDANGAIDGEVSEPDDQIKEKMKGRFTQKQIDEFFKVPLQVDGPLVEGKDPESNYQGEDKDANGDAYLYKQDAPATPDSPLNEALRIAKAKHPTATEMCVTMTWKLTSCYMVICPGKSAEFQDGRTAEVSASKCWTKAGGDQASTSKPGPTSSSSDKKTKEKIEADLKKALEAYPDWPKPK